jgi:hypothetical protein
MYNGALADMGLGTDPYTGNRYAFTGGNPTSRIELDGHDWWNPTTWFSDGGKGGTKTAPKLGGGWLTAVNVFLDGIGWNTSTGASGYETDPGDTPDYDKGLLLKPDSKKEWQGGADRFPFTREDCGRGKSMTYYMPLDQQGRAQGAYACLTKGGFNYTDKNGDNVQQTPPTEIMGSNAPWPPSTPGFWDSIPPGFKLGNKPTMNRGHLLARQLGGSGTDRRNLVPLYRAANSPEMSGAEQKIADSIAAGNTVFYSSVPVYENQNNPIPIGVTMTAYTSKGVQVVNQTILNKP